MARYSDSNTQTVRYNLMLGLFLKLLAFFIILYIYADVDPVKLNQAENSVKDQFNIDVSLSLESSGTTSQNNVQVNETAGYSLQNLDTELRAQFDILSTRHDRDNDTMILRIPARIALAVDNRLPSSPAFAEIFVHTLQTQKSDQFQYAVDLIAIGEQTDSMMKAVSVLVQQIQSYSYPQELLTIGYMYENVDKPLLEIRIKPITVRSGS